ncbi:efflux RND transporter periplasmic adaptor subunit [Candidatus Nitronereus thalassa]|uniref:Efflux RND transporter periplasmic adaptor subunit n=1 Tax=Candidatus Nitronereus thalassa TaxID=3020898 RepID=A0ABU3K8I9_9BACT|nr:efflux RND transporter periplasmic adaptor subunit [Candidatus Nitronereus thalassa]MDT7042696.1 efflux RND transporter periplasmic adaptor subunit [Candidatus Nitronereus thalassa]
MKSASLHRLPFTLLAAGLLVGTMGCNEQQAAPPPPGRPPAPVRVASILKQPIQQSVTLVGTVEPWKRSIVASEIEGLVQVFPVEEGNQAKKGQVLARLRTATLNIQLDSALASHREARTRYHQAQQDLGRIRVLFDKELVTQKEFDDALAEEGALRERLSQLDAEIRRVKDQLKKSQILAPFDGWITQEFTEVGQWVEAGGQIVEMVDLSHVKVEVPLPERYIGDIHTGNSAEVSFDSLPDLTAKGTVFSVVAQADRVARTFPVKIDIPNPNLTIKSGMVSRVTLKVGHPHEGIVIPKDALVLRGGQEFVFLVNEGTVGQVRVKSLVHLDEWVEVSGDVQEGMSVVVEGNERLFPGQPVRILDMPQPTS